MDVTAKYHFASDNTAGICPEAWAALEETNAGFLPSYGDDETTRAACETFRELFETDCDVYFVFNGTAANSLALSTLSNGYHSLIVGEASNVETDECGAPEFFSNGSKLLRAKHHQGKLDPADVERLITSRTDIHFPRPRGLSLSQSTELGTVYTHSELRALTRLAHRHGLKVHMDGARFFNALAGSPGSAADITWRAGIDVLCCGGTKLGMAVTEAVVFFDRALGAEFAYRCKQAGQLASKMRFLAAPWVRMFETGAWLANARHANASAQRFAHGIAGISGVELMAPVEANAVFLRLSDAVAQGLRERGWEFYTFIGGGARFMFAWDALGDRIDALAEDGVFFGGGILAGRQLLRQALAAGTAGVGDAQGECVDWPRSTADAVATASQWAMRGVLETARSQLAATLGRPVPLVLTGGEAAWLAPCLAPPWQLHDDLILEGLRWVAQDLNAPGA